MKYKAVKIGLTSLVLAPTFGGLLYTTMAEGTEYYKHVDEVTSQPDQWYGKKMKLHGFVVDNTILVNDKTLEYRFDMQTNGQVVKASYKGVVPDTFKNGAEVVLGGILDRDGFHATDMTAKCPSKYDPKSATPGNTRGASGGGR